MRLNDRTSGRGWRVRPDGRDKATGRLDYLTDLSEDTMLFGKVVRSGMPHARLYKVVTEKAMKIPGVVSVLTAADIPGLNGFGIADPNQPVFCDHHIRFEGDAIAAVAATSREAAERAAEAIFFDSALLPVLDSPEKALEDDAIPLHPKGNILHERHFEKGNTAEGFDQAAYIVEETYHTPRQMHVFMETEGGLFIPEEDGSLTVKAATQHGYKDRMQLSRILDMDEEKIRIISSPIGGSFGGKDELNVQPYGALLALSTQKPVKMHFSREESVIAGIKRHPMSITMKTGMTADGKLVAHEASIISDTGAYATLGGPVLNFAVEHTVGPYRIDHVKLEGKAVYTNNGVSGEFRGFGGNQATFALEGQLDRLAEKSGIDPVELRRRNIRGEHDLGPLEQQVAANDGPALVLSDLTRSELYHLPSCETDEQEPWIRRGRGVALAFHGSGLGYGIPDPAGGMLTLTAEGKIEASFGHEEFGQGLIGTLEVMLTEAFTCEVEDVSIQIGDTRHVPPSGSSTASRTTNMVWQSIQRMKEPFCELILKEAARQLNTDQDDLTMGAGGVHSKADGAVVLDYRTLANGSELPLTLSTDHHFPVTPDKVMGGHYLYGSTAVIAEVEVNTLNGKVAVTRVDHAVSAGEVMNPLGYLGQIEGGSIMALGFTLSEDAVIEKGRYVTRNLDSYLVPTIQDVPAVQYVEANETLSEGDRFGPRGVGEIGSVALAPAIVKAVREATGAWHTSLPITPDKVLDSTEPFAWLTEDEKEVSP
ncbi:xanthine dehydrogenase subunit D [Salisediminibacterium selenitireducens]|uniref:Xanthine dehydrogenase D subunit n=1 Tax=Bacillus selenitireducens (strain ATCC 700615 / DSM 15326 / MLS10) TaxID=439292 RepID=D6XY39_BACIE|nr:xanthine dehydrogenase subunit D [Salisediminibacterium selenitireducens]ADH98112.1 xanthine dehydrogenase D subunit [[Bacillus] selenitireducens MLS10]